MTYQPIYQILFADHSTFINNFNNIDRVYNSLTNTLQTVEKCFYTNWPLAVIFLLQKLHILHLNYGLLIWGRSSRILKLQKILFELLLVWNKSIIVNKFMYVCMYVLCTWNITYFYIHSYETKNEDNIIGKSIKLNNSKNCVDY